MPGLREICNVLNRTYRRGLDADIIAEAYVAGAKAGGAMEPKHEEVQAFHAAAVEKQAAELIAEAILVVADGLLSSLNEALLRPVVIDACKKRKTQKSAGKPSLSELRTHVNTAAGERLAGGVPVDELLDAFGNMPRHRGEWRHDQKNGKRSLRTVARFLKDDPKLSSVDDAILIVFNEPEVALKILDAIAGAGEAPLEPAVDCDVLCETLLETGEKIIDKHWPEWAAVENERRARLRVEQEAAASAGLGPREAT